MQDVLAAIRRLRRDQMQRADLPRAIWSLFVQSLRNQVKKIEAELDEKVNSYELVFGFCLLQTMC